MKELFRLSLRAHASSGLLGSSLSSASTISPNQAKRAIHSWSPSRIVHSVRPNPAAPMLPRMRQPEEVDRPAVAVGPL
jgi:hypothetical protein